MNAMTIGKLAKATGVSTETIRYYERCGLLPPPDRLPSGYRVYRPESRNRLSFIKQAQNLGFTLQEIEELIALTADDEADCAMVAEKARHKLEEIVRKIKTLKKMRAGLEILSRRCPGDEQPLSECCIINYLSGEEALNG
ncbi:heavy metal-responsive transcriptional regulator [Emcibacter sp.]|uniref:heavy metal-responsive transcriptional regulator n=1 Tax=Emcibacter sp. TaxID=1979954 RepID=UPI002AA86234|nr:heavy metal-responsive transcriptional regulator [Emcibacter sp.]